MYFIVLGVPWMPMPKKEKEKNSKEECPCLALKYLLDNLWLLEKHYQPT